MELDEWEAFRACAIEELREKQRRLQDDYGIGGFARWWFDQETASLQFFDREGCLRLDTSFNDIGSYSPLSHTWKWAWCNDSVLPAMRQAAGPLRELCAVTVLAAFHREDPFEVDEGEDWELAASAVQHLGALGCYRTPPSAEASASILAFMAAAPIALP